MSHINIVFQLQFHTLIESIHGHSQTDSSYVPGLLKPYFMIGEIKDIYEKETY